MIPALSAISVIELVVTKTLLLGHGCNGTSSCYLELSGGIAYPNTNPNPDRQIHTPTSSVLDATHFYLTPLKNAQLSNEYMIRVSNITVTTDTEPSSTSSSSSNGVNSSSSAHTNSQVFSFDIENIGEAACPFLFLEIINESNPNPNSNPKDSKSDIDIYSGIYNNPYTGWFSDNNYLLNGYTRKSVIYTQITRSMSNYLSIDEFENRLQFRCLQDLYRC